MPTYSTQAIVLKRANYGEADRLVTLLTEKCGRVAAIARGVRKPLSKLRGFLELFTYGNFRLAHGKTFDTVVEVTPQDYFFSIREDERKRLLAYGLVELFITTLEDQERHPGLLEWAIGWLRAINDEYRLTNDQSMTQADASLESDSSFRHSKLIRSPRFAGEVGNADLGIQQLYYTAMLTQYLLFIGHAPNLGECGICRNIIESNNLAWSHESGGFIHQACGQSIHDTRSIKVDVGKLLRFVCEAKPGQISKLTIDRQTIESTAYLIYDFFRYQVGKELRLMRQIC